MDVSVTGPLNGLLVLSLEQAVAAPYCSSRLADAGARVVKIERAVGDFARGYDSVVHGESAYFVWLNRGKQSLTANIKDSEDAALLERILAKADVFIQNLAPGAAERAGFGSAELRERYPRLISCDISGYGETESYADMKAYDLLVQAESGLCSVTGGPEGPGRVGVSVCDIACGMYTHTAILEALLQRGLTGEGAGIQVSLFDALADWMTVPLLHYDYGGEAPRRFGLFHPSIHPYGAYPTSDGRLVLISIQNEREFHSLCANVLEQAGLPQDPRFENNEQRCAHREDMDGIIKKVFGALTRGQLISRLRDARVAFGEVNDIAGLSVHPALRRLQVGSPTGPIEMVAPPARWNAGERSPGAVPGVGEHSEAIRLEFSA